MFFRFLRKFLFSWNTKNHLPPKYPEGTFSGKPMTNGHIKFFDGSLDYLNVNGCADIGNVSSKTTIRGETCVNGQLKAVNTDFLGDVFVSGELDVTQTQFAKTCVVNGSVKSQKSTFKDEFEVMGSARLRSCTAQSIFMASIERHARAKLSLEQGSTVNNVRFESKNGKLNVSPDSTVRVKNMGC